MAYISNSRRLTNTEEPAPPVTGVMYSCDPDVPPAGEEVIIEATGEPAKKSKSKEPLPSSVINESTMAFRMDSRTLWTKYALGLVTMQLVMLLN